MSPLSHACRVDSSSLDTNVRCSTFRLSESYRRTIATMAWINLWVWVRDCFKPILSERHFSCTGDKVNQ